MAQYFPYLLVLIGAFARMLPHAPNFTPIAALALFGAVYLNKRDGMWVPLAALAFSDFFIGFYHPLVMAAVYGSFMLTGLLGVWLRRARNVIPDRDREDPESKNKQTSSRFGFLFSFLDSRVRGNDNKKIVWWPRVFSASLLGSILFFLITNWAVWAWGALYPKTIDGLLLSYWMGLPFFRNSLSGDLFYVGVFFGAVELARRYAAARSGAARARSFEVA